MIEKIPNILSVARIVSAPVMLIVSFFGLSNAFLSILLFAFISDGLDGFVARCFNCQSGVGGRLDTWGDFAVFLVLPYCVYMLWPSIIYEELLFVAIAGISMAIPLLVGFIKFKRMISFHTYLSKVSFFVMSLSVCVLLLIDFRWLFHFAVFVQLISSLELLLIILRLREYRWRVKSYLSLYRND